MLFKDAPDFISILGALIISLVSGFISISRRVIGGYPATCLWVISETLTAILCGYLMFHTYPYLVHMMPEWFTWPLAVALAAHLGGRCFQAAEDWLIHRYQLISGLERSDKFQK